MDKKAVRKLIKKNAIAKSDGIIAAIKGYNIETDRAKKLGLARGHLDYLNEMITQTEVELYVRIKPYYEFVEFISTMPGMTELSSTIVLAETGANMIALMMQNTFVPGADFLLPTMNLLARKNLSELQKHVLI